MTDPDQVSRPIFARTVATSCASAALLVAFLFAVRARAQEQSPALPAPDVFASQGEPVYSDQFSLSCDKYTISPYVGMDPLTCVGVTGPAVNGQCSMQGATLWKQVGSGCYYCRPINPPIKGFVVARDQMVAADRQGFRCAPDEADPDCYAICTGNGAFNPPQGVTLEGPAPQSAPPSGPLKPPLQGHVTVTAPSNACLLGGPGGYNYCDNSYGIPQPAGCVCPGREPPKTQPQPANPVDSAGQYLQGMVDGLGNCVQGFMGIISGAGFFLKGDFQQAAQLWGVEPGQSVVLKSIFSQLQEFTTPIVGSNVSAYQQGVVGGRRICSYVLVPAVRKGVASAVKNGVNAPAAPKGGGGPPAIQGPQQGPPQLPAPPAKPTWGSPPYEDPPALPGKGSGPPQLPGPGSGTVAVPQSTGTVPSPQGSAPALPAPITGGISASDPVQGSQLQDAINSNPSGLGNKWVQLPSGPTQLGGYIGEGSFADVYKIGGGKVIKLSKNSPSTYGYGADSIAGQYAGAGRLNAMGVETPAVFNYQPGGGDQPASLIADDVASKWPGAKPLTRAGFQAMTAAQQAQALSAINNLSSKLAGAGYAWLDTNPSNITLQVDGDTFKPIIHDPDMIMNMSEIQNAIAQKSVPWAVLQYALEQAGQPDFLSKPFTVESLMQVLERARINQLQKVPGAPAAP